jgi:hypothetical protein
MGILLLPQVAYMVHKKSHTVNALSNLNKKKSNPTNVDCSFSVVNGKTYPTEI